MWPDLEPVWPKIESLIDKTTLPMFNVKFVYCPSSKPLNPAGVANGNQYQAGRGATIRKNVSKFQRLAAYPRRFG